MKVKEAIELLQKENPDAELVIESGDYELKGEIVSVENFISFNSYSSSKSFTDSFDDARYNKIVWTRCQVGGEEVILMI